MIEREIKNKSLWDTLTKEEQESVVISFRHLDSQDPLKGRLTDVEWQQVMWKNARTLLRLLQT